MRCLLRLQNFVCSASLNELKTIIKSLTSWDDNEVFVGTADSCGYHGNRIISDFALKFLDDGQGPAYSYAADFF
jgi:hypothetical protein